MNKNFFFRRFNRSSKIDSDPGQHGLVFCRIGDHPDYPRAPFPMCFTRSALCALIDSVGTLPPESGAMGFSPKDAMGFDVIEFDAGGSDDSGGAVYRPDVSWSNKRCEHHQGQPDAAFRLWTGHIHSHPGGFGSPSGKSGRAMGDLGYVEETFEMNEWMEWFFVPILTGTGTDEVTIHPWVCRRGNPVKLMIADLQVTVPGRFPKRPFNSEWEDRMEREARERAAKQLEEEARQSRPVTVKSDKEPARTVDSAADVRSAEKGVPVGALSSAMVVAQSVTDHGFSLTQATALAEYTKRLKGVISPAFRDKTILVVGVGAGSYAVEKLLRLCPQAIRICDFDSVEMSNLARTAYTVKDAVAKRLKVDALAMRAAEINPWVEVRPYATSLTRMSRFQLDEMFDGVDLVIGGTDMLEAQALTNQEAVRRGIPAVYIGIHAGAQGGRVIWYLPEKTPCYRCVARDRFETAATGQSGDVNLVAATGSILDCQFIDMVATKVAVALLERGQDSAMGRFFTRMSQRNDVVIRCDPDYEWGSALWSAVLGDLPKAPKDYARELNDEVFLAMDTIWMKGAYDPQCPVCGGGKAMDGRKL